MRRLSIGLLKAICLFLLAVVCYVAGAKATEYHVSVKGSDNNSGTLNRPFLTIRKASSVVVPGDMITVHEGVYREMIIPLVGGSSEKQRITYQSALKEKVEIKGSEIVKGWKFLANGIWQVTLANSYFGTYNPYKDLVFGDWFFPGRNKVHTGEVYWNGKPLGEVAKAEKPMSWSTENKADSTVIYANFGNENPNRGTVEINVRPSCFYPAKTGINYITIRGFHMSQAATQWAAPTAEQIGLIGTNWSKGWIIENNVLSDSKCVGVALGKDRASGHNVWFENMQVDGAVHYNEMVKRVIAEGWSKETIGSHVVRNNIIFRCGQAGVCGSFGAAFSEISGNDIFDIYTYRNFWGAEIAGIKLHGGIDALIKGNRIHNTQKGIWLDWMTQGTRVSRNLLYDNDFVDLFLEVNHGPYLVDNNLFLSKFSLRDLSQGGAFVNNLFMGLLARASDKRATPYFKPNATQLLGNAEIKGGDNRFIGNIFVGKRGQSYVNQAYTSQSNDSIDSLAGYGLSIYEHAALPVLAKNNVYLNGAFPLDGETSPALDYHDGLIFKLNTVKGNSQLTLISPYKLFASGLVAVDTKELGKTITARQGYTLPNGRPFIIQEDYLGHKRKEKSFAGPLFFKTGEVIRVWPVLDK